MSRPEATSLSTRRHRLPYAPGLDGLRAVAVVAVIVFHAGAPWLPGGFLGVDVFFVISGFLITSLLLSQHRSNGHIGFGGFWSRRARRLLPALLVLLAVMAIWARTSWPDPVQLHAFPGDAFASLAYVANWHFAAQGTNYFTQFSAPSPLQHVWSLAIEEQFYLVWPLLLATFLAVRSLGRRGLLAVALAGAGVSIALMALWYSPTNPSAVYFQTDTHAFGLLFGAAAALLVAGPLGERVRRACSVVSPLALGGLVACLVLLDGRQAIAYQGGIALAALLTVPVVVAAARPGLVSTLLGRRPLVQIGVISYGLYLWHWPIWTILTDARLGVGWVEGTVIRAGLLLVTTLASYWLVERPIRHGVPRGWAVRLATPVAVGGVAAAVVAVPVAPPLFTPPVQVSAATASRQPPVHEAPRVLIVGDSTAASAAIGFIDVSKGSYIVIPAGMPPKTPGSYCPLDIWSDAIRETPGDVRVHPPSPECEWPVKFPPLVQSFDPSAVVVMWSLWDGMPHRVNGQWLEVGTPGWDAELTAAADCAISQLSVNGARVYFVLAPPMVQQPFWQTAALDSVYQAVAAADPSRVGVIDDRRPIQSGATYYRWDGIHYTQAGADVLATAALPMLEEGVAAPRLPPAPPAPCAPPSSGP
jgi:peptidoglycan/LPS O-acetylase OafA/YrhL